MISFEALNQMLKTVDHNKIVISLIIFKELYKRSLYFTLTLQSLNSTNSFKSYFTTRTFLRTQLNVQRNKYNQKRHHINNI